MSFRGEMSKRICFAFAATKKGVLFNPAIFCKFLAVARFFWFTLRSTRLRCNGETFSKRKSEICEKFFRYALQFVKKSGTI